jgi:hypothetical protein
MTSVLETASTLDIKASAFEILASTLENETSALES